MTDEVLDDEEYMGFDPNFSRNCEQVFRAASIGAFLTVQELRTNLRIAGMWLGPDEIETPEFQLPDISGGGAGDDESEDDQ